MIQDIVGYSCGGVALLILFLVVKIILFPSKIKMISAHTEVVLDCIGYHWKSFREIMKLVEEHYQKENPDQEIMHSIGAMFNILNQLEEAGYIESRKIPGKPHGRLKEISEWRKTDKAAPSKSKLASNQLPEYA